MSEWFLPRDSTEAGRTETRQGGGANELLVLQMIEVVHR